MENIEILITDKIIMRSLPSELRRKTTLLAVLLMAGGLIGCSQRPGADVPIVLSAQPYDATLGAGPQSVLLPSGAYHLVTVRKRPYSGEEVLCSEPSPDWAVAFGTALKVSGNGGVSGGASGALNGSYETTEAITALAGRTAGVVALRDGLYSACQAYANGIIGKDAYALILSQYGNLLVALAGGSYNSGSGGNGGGSNTPSSPSSITPPGITVAVSTGNTPPPASSSRSSSSGGSTSPGGNTQGGNTSQANTFQNSQLPYQILQGMEVACITNGDRSIPVATDVSVPTAKDGQFTVTDNTNQSLTDVCRTLMPALALQLPNLIPIQSAPQRGTGSMATNSKVTAALPKKGVTPLTPEPLAAVAH